MGKQGKNKHGDPIFLFLFLNVLYMAGICAKFEKHLDMTSFPRALPLVAFKFAYFLNYCPLLLILEISLKSVKGSMVVFYSVWYYFLFLQTVLFMILIWKAFHC